MDTPNHPQHRHFAASRLLGLAALTLVLSVAASASTVIYSQPFDNSQGTARQFNAAMNSLGWSVYTAATGEKISSETLSPDSTIYSSPPSVNSGSIARVYLGTDIDVSQDEVSTIAFDSVRSSGSGRVQLLIQIDNDNWYVSNTVFNPVTAASWAAAGDANVNLSLAFSPSASDWSLATLVPDSPMSISGGALTEDLPAGNITGLGWWVTNAHASNGVTVRLDNMQVLSAPIPEPATAAALLGLAGFVLVLVRRRARA